MGFSLREHWSGLLLPPPADLADTGTEPVSPAPAGGFFTTGTPGKPRAYTHGAKNQHTEMAARARQEGHSSGPLRSLQGVIMPL